MKEFFKMMFAAMLGNCLMWVIFLVLIFIGIGVLVSSFEPAEEVYVPNNSILHIRLEAPISERVSESDFLSFAPGTFEPVGTTGLNTILQSIRRAKTDSHIKGIFIETTTIAASLTMTAEIRDAVRDFKTSGKPVIAYSENFDQKEYFFASAADSVYLNPKGNFSFRGLTFTVMFFKGLLDKLEIDVQAIRAGKFKSAVEPFLNTQMSPENRLQFETLLNDYWNTILNTISDARAIPVDTLRLLADENRVIFPEDALQYHFVNGLTYYDEIREILKRTMGVEEISLYSLEKYRKAPPSAEEEAQSKAEDKIAVVYASGTIMSGGGNDQMIGSASYIRTLRAIREDDKIKAVVLRINSPGGDALASETILRELSLLKEKKPLVVSMGEFAASGGYYIACLADTIVAMPTTITGSIGVFSLMISMDRFFRNTIGITTDGVKTGKYADMGTGTRPLSPEEIIVMEKEVDAVYKTFLTHVAKGRSMPVETVDSIAQGRVWSGIQAKQIGLVDELGGIQKAIDFAAARAGISNYRIVSLPVVEDFWTRFLNVLSESSMVRSIKERFPVLLDAYSKIKDLLESKGVQARFPYSLNFE